MTPHEDNASGSDQSKPINVHEDEFVNPYGDKDGTFLPKSYWGDVKRAAEMRRITLKIGDPRVIKDDHGKWTVEGWEGMSKEEKHAIRLEAGVDDSIGWSEDLHDVLIRNAERDGIETPKDRERREAAEKLVIDKEIQLNLVRVKYPDLVKRAGQLLKDHAFDFPDVKFTGTGENILTVVDITSDTNRLNFLSALFGKSNCPHFSTFRGMVTDENGKPLGAKHKLVPVLIHAARAAGLKNQSINAMSNALQTWALSVEYNDLTIKFNDRVKRWDGAFRLESWPSKLMGTVDSERNRTLWRYFFTSLYMRITQPGCEAPIMICLLGGQDAGKSYFSKRICQEVISITGKDWDNITPAKINVNSDDYNPLLRKITGNTVIANVPEMKGYERVKLAAFKDFITETADFVDQKWRDVGEVSRQWVQTMDGNSYSGLFRDETGERRLYPFFVGENPELTGDIRWDLDFKADFSDFSENFWQMMAEAKAWIEEHGREGYSKLVETAKRTVETFTSAEVATNSGTAKFDPLNSVLRGLLISVPKRFGTLRRMREKGKPLEYAEGIIFDIKDIRNKFSELRQGGNSVSTQMITGEMCGVGMVKVDLGHNKLGYCYPVEGISAETFAASFAKFIETKFDTVDYAAGDDRVSIFNDPTPTTTKNESEGF